MLTRKVKKNLPETTQPIEITLPKFSTRQALYLLKLIQNKLDYADASNFRENNLSDLGILYLTVLQQSVEQSLDFEDFVTIQEATLSSTTVQEAIKTSVSTTLAPKSNPSKNIFKKLSKDKDAQHQNDAIERVTERTIQAVCSDHDPEMVLRELQLTSSDWASMAKQIILHSDIIDLNPPMAHHAWAAFKTELSTIALKTLKDFKNEDDMSSVEKTRPFHQLDAVARQYISKQFLGFLDKLKGYGYDQSAKVIHLFLKMLRRSQTETQHNFDELGVLASPCLLHALKFNNQLIPSSSGIVNPRVKEYQFFQIVASTILSTHVIPTLREDLLDATSLKIAAARHYMANFLNDIKHDIVIPLLIDEPKCKSLDKETQKLLLNGMLGFFQQLRDAGYEDTLVEIYDYLNATYQASPEAKKKQHAIWPEVVGLNIAKAFRLSTALIDPDGMDENAHLDIKSEKLIFITLAKGLVRIPKKFNKSTFLEGLEGENWDVEKYQLICNQLIDRVWRPVPSAEIRPIPDDFEDSDESLATTPSPKSYSPFHLKRKKRSKASHEKAPDLEALKRDVDALTHKIAQFEVNHTPSDGRPPLGAYPSSPELIAKDKSKRHKRTAKKDTKDSQPLIFSREGNGQPKASTERQLGLWSSSLSVKKAQQTKPPRKLPS